MELVLFFFLDFDAGDIAYNGSNIAPSVPQAYGSWKCDIIQTPRDSALLLPIVEKAARYYRGERLDVFDGSQCASALLTSGDGVSSR